MKPNSAKRQSESSDDQDGRDAKCEKTIEQNWVRMLISRVARRVVPGFAVAILIPVAAQAATVPGATPGSFSVSDTGAATYSIPIQVPPGINGMQPQLSLSYSSQSGDGIAGMGWSVSGMSSITRCPATIAHDGAGNNHGIRYDNTDKFCLDGKRLRLDSGVYGAANAVYRFEIDDFTKITQNGSGPTSFTVQTADGMTLEYGAESSARLAVGAGSVNTRWMINNVKDTSTSQNTIHYSYSESDGVLYLNSIEYSGDSTRSVEFDYENRAAKDQITRYFGGSAYTQKKRLQNIRTEVNSTTIKVYKLVYESVVSGRTDRTRLASVQECDAVSGGNCFAATAIDWSYGTDSYDSPVGSTSTGNDFEYSFAMDSTGDGIADIVFSDGTNWDILPGNASGGFGSRINTTVSSINKGYAQTIDYDGDGKRDLVVATPGGNWKIVRSTGIGLTLIDTGVPTNYAEDYYTVADYDGDGLEDIVIMGGGNSIWVHKNTGGGLAASVLLLTLESSESFGVAAGFATSSVKSGGAPDFDGDLKADILYRYTKTITPDCGGEPGCFETPYDINYWAARISGSGNKAILVVADDFGDPRLGDFNGDGLTDVALRSIGSGNVWHIKFGNGVGFTTVVTSVGGSSAPFPFDFDADGLTDLMYQAGSTWYVIRSDGNTFEAPLNTGIQHGVVDNIYRLADINGDGLTDLVYADESESKWKVIQHGGTRRDLVAKVTDGLGNYFEPNYAVPTDANVYATGTGASFPNFDYIGAKTLVKSYETNDGIGGSNSVSYFYKGWKVNVHGLGALGFSEIRESLPSNLVAARQFSQSHPTIGMVTRSTLEEREGGNDKNEIGNALLSETDLSVASHTVSGAPSGNPRYINYVSGIISKRYDLGGAGSAGTPLTTDEVEIAMNFSVGLPSLVERTIDDIEGNTFTIDTNNQYESNMSSAWCVGMLKDIETTMTVSSITEVRHRTASNDLNKCRANSETAETSDGTLEQTTSYFYDSYGNINQINATAVGSNQTRTTTLNYGPENGYFPRTIVNALNQTQTITWDKGFGQPLTLTDPNGLTVTNLYDSFGRATRVTYPDGVRIDSTLASCGTGCIDLTSTESDGVSNGLRAFTRFDQLGRPVRQGQIMLDGTTSYVHTDYDSLGRVDRVSNPTTNTSTGSVWSTFIYDDLGRTKQETRPGPVSNRVTSVSYSDLSTTVTLPVSSHTRVFDYDGLGQVVRVSESGTGSSGSSDTATTTYGYGPFGTLRTVSPPGVTATSINYNKRGWKEQIVDPDTGTTRYAYNGFGELLTLTQGYGSNDEVDTGFEYDLLGRLIRRVDAEENRESEWTYDDAPGAGIGQPSTVSMGPVSGTSDYFRSYDYNNTGQLTSTLYAFESEQFIVDQTYNSLGRLATLTYPDSTPPAGMPEQISTSEPTSYDGSYTISWTAAAGTADNYQISESDDGGQTWSADVNVGTSLSKLYSGQAEDTYKYRVKSCLGTACSSYIEGAQTTVQLTPTLPSTLTVTPAQSTDGAYTVAWSSSVGNVDQYKLSEKIGAGSWGADINLGTATSKAYTGKGNGTYTYKVRACYGAYCSAYKTGSTNVATVSLPPTSVGSISTNDPNSTDGNYTISWSAPAGSVTKYWLSEKINAGGWGADSDQGLSLSKAYSGKANGSYEYRVKACNGASCSGYTAGANTTVTLPPGTPASITVPASSTSGNYTVSWGSSTGTVTAYKLYEANNSSFTGQTEIYSGTGQSKAISKGINESGTYYYRVKAFNGAAGSGYRTGSNSAVVTIAPSAPATITVPSSNTSGSYTINWTAPSSGTVTGYQLYEANNAGFTGQTLVYSGSSLSKAITKSSAQSGTYYYRVRAGNGSQYSAYKTGSNGIAVTVAPGTPASITVPSTGNENYTISWGAASGTVTAYKLYEATNSSFSNQTEIYSGTSLSKAITKGVSGSGTYYYRVKAFNGSQGSAYRTGGNAITVTTKPSVPPGIGRNPGWLTQGGNYTIMWTASTGNITAYQMQRASNTAFSANVSLPYSGTALSKVVTNAPVGTWYHRVRACNTVNACSDWREHAKVTVVSGGGGGGPIPYAKIEMYEGDEAESQLLASAAPDESTGQLGQVMALPTVASAETLDVHPVSASVAAKRQPNAVIAQRGIPTRRTAAPRLTKAQQLERDLEIESLAAELGVPDTFANPRRDYVERLASARYSQMPFAGSGGGGSGSGSRLTIEYDYQNGYLKDIKDADNPQTPIWEATQINQFGQITEATLGNGVITGYDFDPNTGELNAIQSGKTGVSEIQDLSYDWDDLGNLTERQDHNINKTETFQYDGLNRLHKAHLNSSQVLQMGYAPNGNINSKTGSGTYQTSSSYNYTSNTHKVSSITGVSSSIVYDARGNMKTGMGRTITWSSYNKPTFIDAGSNESTFKYGPERARYFQQREFGSNISTVLYVGGLFQKITRADNVTEFRHAIQANGSQVATVIRRDDFDHEMLYLHHDHLGSVTTITDEQGAVVEELSFDAFGKRRSATDWLSDLSSGDREDINELYDRGYTGHEQLDNLELVHMNGRVYDPGIGRFLSADPLVPQPFSTQSFNRFSYLQNNPLNATDPSGFTDDELYTTQLIDINIFYIGPARGLRGPRPNSEQTPPYHPPPTREPVPVQPAGPSTAAAVAGTQAVAENGQGTEYLVENNLGTEAASFALDMVPVLGAGKSFLQVFTGTDLVTGQPLSRGMEAVGVVAGFIPGGKALLKGNKAAEIGGAALRATRGWWTKVVSKGKALASSIVTGARIAADNAGSAIGRIRDYTFRQIDRIRGGPNGGRQLGDFTRNYSQSVGAARRVPSVLQTGGNKLRSRTARSLNEQLGENLPAREWGRALEGLKRDFGLPNNHHGRILDNGDYVDDAGDILGNLLDYVP